ncbi:hypothetical protein BDN67DRAFT_230016 [Paxillus ammoniavirescens]|nr:hypothetical protein BDN67DRAFT_230016 [Paxillus ammoniavirescens]
MGRKKYAISPVWNPCTRCAKLFDQTQGCLDLYSTISALIILQVALFVLPPAPIYAASVSVGSQIHLKCPT